MDREVCVCCERELKPGTEVWLELDIDTNRYSDPQKNPIPAERSQGSFPFGKTCAKKMLARTPESRNWRVTMNENDSWKGDQSC